MKINRRESKFFTMMMIESFIFTGVTLIFIGIITIGMIYFLFINKSEEFYVPFEDNMRYVLKGEYENIDIEKQLGEGSCFYVFDEGGMIIYSSDKRKEYPYNSEETKWIRGESGDISTTKFKLKDNKGKEFEKIQHEKFNGEIVFLIIIDNEKNIIFSNDDIFEMQLTDNEYECLLSENEEYKLIRENFIGDDKREYTIVFFNHIDRRDNIDRQLIMLMGYVLAMIIAVLMISAGLFLFRLNKRVNKPILLLENAINDFKIGKENKEIEYKGPKEFVEICDKFNDMAKRLNESQNENSKMLGDISHDLKTPITVLQSYARAINDGMVEERDQKEYLESIYDKAEELEKLVNMFSEYSKLSRSDYKLDFRRVDMVEFLREYLISKYNELEFLGFDLEIDMTEEECLCDIDEFQMKRVFENIISNSVKHNQKGTKIYVEIAKESEAISIKMGDDGIGIGAELRESIFKAFVTGNMARTDGKSTGLGLSIVKKIVELHRGNVNLVQVSQSELKTEFDIRLPIIK